MKIKIKDTSNTLSVPVTKPLAQIPPSQSLSSQSLSFKSELPLKKYIEERPLKTNSKNLSFKGLSLDVSPKILKEGLDHLGKNFGKEASNNFRAKINQALSVKSLGLKGSIETGITHTEQKIGQRILDVLIYPVKELPFDIVNSVFGFLKKVPIVKDFKLIDTILELKPFKDKRIVNEGLSTISSMKTYFDPKDGWKNVLADGHGRFNPLKANYSTTAERSLTRFVTGALPAFFLANDAYNLSIYMNNNKDLAKKEKKKRFNQEIARILVTAGATFGVLKLFSKSSNSTPWVSAALINIVTFGSEFFGRMIVGTPVMPLSKAKAKEYAIKQGKAKDNNKKSSTFNFSSNLIENAKNQKFSGTSKEKEKPSIPKKGSLTFANVMKALGAMAVFGYGVNKAKQFKCIQEDMATVTNWYSKKLFKEDYTMPRKNFVKLMDKLKENGFDALAEKYEKIVAKQTGNTIKLGKISNRTKQFLIHDVLTFPIRYAWGILNLPYNIIVKVDKFLTSQINQLNKVPKAAKALKTPEKPEDMLTRGLMYLEKIEKDSNFKEKLNSAILGGFDKETKSEFSNAELGELVKNTTSAVTSGFLIADNYNMVMIDTQDKELAGQKAKERTIQRLVRLAYGAFLVKFYNNMFAKTVNGSLVGAQSVNTLYALTTETLERKSVGLPLKESTKEEIQEKEKENLNTSGLIGAYYRLMARLTGKKTLAQMQMKMK